MDRTTDDTSRVDDSIQVGTTGKIASLMTKELEFMSSSPTTPPPPAPAPRKLQSPPVSVPCGSISRKIVQHRTSRNDLCSNSSCSSSSIVSSSSNGLNHLPSPGVAATQKPQTNVHHVPMLISDGGPKERNVSTKKNEKKGRISIVEVVDIKCNNPMSSRLRKLGFSKLSDTIS